MAAEASAHLALVGDLEDLIERDERVLAADGVLLEVAEVQVRGHQDVDHGVLLRRSILGGLGQSKAGDGERSTVGPLPRDGRALTKLTLTETRGMAHHLRPRARVKARCSQDLQGRRG